MTAARSKPGKAARPRGASRPTPKVSPLRGMPVATWVRERSTGWQADVVLRLLDLVRTTAPGATVVIKWGQPVVEENGPVAYIKLATAHVTFGFWRGADLPDPGGVLEGGAQMKHVKIKSPDAFDARALSSLLRHAIRLNRRDGDPTRH